MGFGDLLVTWATRKMGDRYRTDAAAIGVEVEPTLDEVQRGDLFISG